MKRMASFLFIFISSLVFVCSYMGGIVGSRVGKAMNIAGQTGLAAGIVLFFLRPADKKPPSKGNDTLNY